MILGDSIFSVLEGEGRFNKSFFGLQGVVLMGSMLCVGFVWFISISKGLLITRFWCSEASGAHEKLCTP